MKKNILELFPKPFIDGKQGSGKKRIGELSKEVLKDLLTTINPELLESDNTDLKKLLFIEYYQRVYGQYFSGAAAEYNLDEHFENINRWIQEQSNGFLKRLEVFYEENNNQFGLELTEVMSINLIFSLLSKKIKSLVNETRNSDELVGLVFLDVLKNQFLKKDLEGILNKETLREKIISSVDLRGIYYTINEYEKRFEKDLEDGRWFQRKITEILDIGKEIDGLKGIKSESNKFNSLLLEYQKLIQDKETELWHIIKKTEKADNLENLIEKNIEVLTEPKIKELSDLIKTRESLNEIEEKIQTKIKNGVYKKQIEYLDKKIRDLEENIQEYQKISKSKLANKFEGEARLAKSKLKDIIISIEQTNEGFSKMVDKLELWKWSEDEKLDILKDLEKKLILIQENYESFGNKYNVKECKRYKEIIEDKIDNYNKLNKVKSGLFLDLKFLSNLYEKLSMNKLKTEEEIIKFISLMEEKKSDQYNYGDYENTELEGLIKDYEKKESDISNIVLEKRSMARKFLDEKFESLNLESKILFSEEAFVDENSAKRVTEFIEKFGYLKPFLKEFNDKKLDILSKKISSFEELHKKYEKILNTKSTMKKSIQEALEESQNIFLYSPDKLKKLKIDLENKYSFYGNLDGNVNIKPLYQEYGKLKEDILDSIEKRKKGEINKIEGKLKEYNLEIGKIREERGKKRNLVSNLLFLSFSLRKLKISEKSYMEKCDELNNNHDKWNKV